jgi:hypothetical protein
MSRRLAKLAPEREIPRFGKHRYAGLTEKEYW